MRVGERERETEHRQIVANCQEVCPPPSLPPSLSLTFVPQIRIASLYTCCSMQSTLSLLREASLKLGVRQSLVPLDFFGEHHRETVLLISAPELRCFFSRKSDSSIFFFFFLNVVFLVIFLVGGGVERPFSNEIQRRSTPIHFKKTPEKKGKPHEMLPLVKNCLCRFFYWLPESCSSSC